MEEEFDFIPERFIHCKDAIVLTDAHGRVLWVNPAFTVLCGYELHELKGKKPGAILQGPETDPQVVRGLRDAIAAGIGCVVELINYHKDEHTYPVHIEIMPIRKENGKVTWFAAIEREFTEVELREIGRDTLQSALHKILEEFVAEIKKH